MFVMSNDFVLPECYMIWHSGIVIFGLQFDFAEREKIVTFMRLNGLK